jgi:hypothetical protein
MINKFFLAFFVIFKGKTYIKSYNINAMKHNKALLIVNAVYKELPNNDRFINYDQRNVTIVLNKTQTADLNPFFEFDSYNLNVLDTTQKGSFLLSIKYKSSPFSSEEFQIEKVSNMQAREYLDFIHDPSVKIIYLYVKSSPLPTDKSGVSFLMSIRNKLMPDVSMSGKSDFRKSYATVTIRVFYTSSQLQTYPIFISPLIEQNLVYVNLANKYMINTTSVIQLNAYVPAQNANITYRILNKGEDLFYIDAYNNIKITYPFPESINIKRYNYLVI